MKFCHIAPTKHLEIFCRNRPAHLCLAHLVEKDEVYAKFYKDCRKRGEMVIMDNSAFEMYKEGKEMYPSEKLADLGRRVDANYVVLSDYPGEHWEKTVNKAIEMQEDIRAAGFKTFFVPQSEVGDVEGLIKSFEWAAKYPHVHYVGVSILAVPNAYDVEKDNKLQRYLSRFEFMKLLRERGILDMLRHYGKGIHFLGMVDGPNEIQLVKDFHQWIDTWDSSAGVWAGLNDIEFDNSPTGLKYGKYEEPVDFDFADMDPNRIGKALRNCKYIDGLCG